MGFKSSSLLCLALVLAVSSAVVHAFDITKLLGQSPEFATFNKYLTETKLVDQINKRNTITVLAVDDAGLGAISGKSPEAIKAILSTHVVLDYFDEKKLMEAQGSKQILTTLYQASGLAVNQQGFLKVALVGEGEIAFGSAVNGAPIDAELVKTVTSQPYNVSILQVSKAIVFPGVDSAQNAKAPVSSSQTTAKAPVPATQGAKAPAKATPAPSSEEVEAPSESVTESPAEAPEATTSSPSLAPGPDGGEADAADAAPPPKSSSSRTKLGLAGAVMGFTSLLLVVL